MLVSEGTFKESWPTTKLSHTGIKLHSYSGESVPVVGTADVTVKYTVWRPSALISSGRRGPKPIRQTLALAQLA